MGDPSLSDESMHSIGARLLSLGRVAIVMAAGGISSRMLGGTFRGKIPVGPVTGKTLFRLQGERVLALRKLYNANLPWIVITSLQSYEQTVEAFRNEGLGGLAEFVQQGSLPAMDTNSKPYKVGREPIQAPTGHGGIFNAMARDGVIDRLVAQGVTDLFLFQFPNVLERVCDPAMLGLHSAQQHDMTLKGFRCLSQSERVGRIIRTDRTIVREYYDPMPNASKYLANMGTYVFKLEFLRNCQNSGVELPWHKVPLQLPGLPTLWRSEQFIFDLLAFAARAGVIKVGRSQEYATIKEPEGKNSPRAARGALLRVYRDWLRKAGATPETPNARVEISPLFALDALTVRSKVVSGTVYPDGAVFR